MSFRFRRGIATTSQLFVAALVSLSPAALATPYFDKAVFLADTGAVSQSGTLAADPSILGSKIINNVTVTSTNWLISGSFSTLIPGNEIAVSQGYGTNDPLADGITIEFPVEVTAAGFDFHEPTAPGPGIDTCGLATCIDSEYLISAYDSNDVLVESFTFTPADNVLSFAGLVAGAPFDRLEIFEVIGNNDNEFYGEIYAPAFDLLPAVFPFENPSPGDDSFFGFDVSQDNGQALVSAYGDSTMALLSGRVYLFDMATGDLLQTFDNPSPDVADSFGYSVSLNNGQALIGAWFDSTTASRAGRAYLFDTATGNLLRTFENPVPDASDYFGSDVSLSGGQALISAPEDDFTASDSGRVYLFDATNGNLLQTFDNPSPDSGDRFGNSIDMDAGLILIGARFDDATSPSSGRAYLFNTTGSLLHTIENPGAAGAWFGSSVSLDNGQALVGALTDDTTGANSGRAYIFDTATGSLLRTFENPTMAAQSNFGSAVSLDSGQALIGAFGDDTNGNDAGRAHLFDSSTGILLRTFENPSPDPVDYFGGAVSLANGEALISAHRDGNSEEDSGRAYLFFDGVQVGVDIDPNDATNTIHPHHDGTMLTNGSLPDDVVPVVVYGDDDLDVSQIDTATVTFGPDRGNVDPSSTPVTQDFNSDSVPDKRFDFLMSDTGIGCEFQEATVLGETTTGDTFVATDIITADCDAQCHN